MTVVVILILIPTTVFIFFRELCEKGKEELQAQTTSAPSTTMPESRSQTFASGAGETMQP